MKLFTCVSAYRSLVEQAKPWAKKNELASVPGTRSPKILTDGSSWARLGRSITQQPEPQKAVVLQRSTVGQSAWRFRYPDLIDLLGLKLFQRKKTSGPCARATHGRLGTNHAVAPFAEATHHHRISPYSPIDTHLSTRTNAQDSRVVPEPGTADKAYVRFTLSILANQDRKILADKLWELLFQLPPRTPRPDDFPTPEYPLDFEVRHSVGCVSTPPLNHHWNSCGGCVTRFEHWRAATVLR